MADCLDDLLRDSDDEDVPHSVQVPQPTSFKNKNRLCSPVKSADRTSCLGVARKVENETKKVFADPFFGIRYKPGAVDMTALKMLCNDMEKISILSNLRSSVSSWVTIGVIVEKSGTLKSSNGNEYMTWKLHDLKNCDDKPRKMLLFGEAVKEHWKLQKGSVVALLSPQMIADDKTAEIIIKCSKASSIVPVGSSADLGKCKGKKQDGSECRAFVNESKCEMCVYHAAGEVRKLAARRGTFSQSILIPKKNDIIKNNPQLMYQTRPKMIISQTSTMKSKEEVIKCEKETLNSMMHEKTNFSLGAKCLLSLSNSKGDTLDKKKIGESASFKDFLNSRVVHETRKMNERTAKEEAAVKRALGVLGKAKTKEVSNMTVKRARVEYQEDQAIEERVNESTGRNRVLELLAKRSKHANEADEMENQMAMDHLTSLEKREAVEMVATSCMELKEVKVFSCSLCKYTARNRSAFCIKQGHAATSHLADKRFFKCKECSYKISCYSLLPTRRCQQCKNMNWERISMVQERKVILDTEKLEVRGEERVFIN